VCSVAPLAVFSAVSGLELSMEKEHHKCRLNLSLIACYMVHSWIDRSQCFIYSWIGLVLSSSQLNYH
jgi:hypothetical protein